MDQIESTVHCGNVHVGLRKGQEPIIFYCASPTPSTATGPGRLQCDHTISRGN